MPTWASLAVASVFLILLYDWVNVSVGSPVRSGLIVALSQILLVDILYVMNGTRGIAAAGASAAVLIVGWTVVGIVYGKLSGGAPAGAAAQTPGAARGGCRNLLIDVWWASTSESGEAQRGPAAVGSLRGPSQVGKPSTSPPLDLTKLPHLTYSP